MDFSSLKLIAAQLVEGKLSDPEHLPRPHHSVVIDLISDEMTPVPEEEEVLEGYKVATRKFRGALMKAGIPQVRLESAKVMLTPTYLQCRLVAGGKVFSASKYW